VLLSACAGCVRASQAGTAPATVAVAPAPVPPPPDEPFRRQAPEPEPALDYFPPEGRMTRLANGMGVLVVERHSTRMVAANLVVRGGLAGFPGEPAAVALLGEGLMTGTATRTERDIYAFTNQALVELELGCGIMACRFGLHGLSSSFDPALEALSDLTLRPTFVENDLEIKRRRALGRASHDGDDTALIGHRAVHAAIFGSSHPLARASQPMGPALEKLTRKDLMRVWREAMDPKRAVLVVAGDVEQSAVVARAEALFGSWKADASVRPLPPIPPASPTQARLIVVDRPRAPQAMILYATSVAPVGTAGYYADLLAHRLLGGMRSSGLEGALRGEGTIWSGHGQVEAGRGPGIFWWETNVARDRVADVLAALASRTGELHERGPSADDLVAVKGLVTHELPRKLETVRSLADAFSWLALLDLPIEYLDNFRARIEETQVDAVRAAVPDPAAMKAVVVGDLAALRAPLLALGWGPIEERDADGNLVRASRPEPPAPATARIRGHSAIDVP
jgi:zinc protease